jgi:hypothetical protein
MSEPPRTATRLILSVVRWEKAKAHGFKTIHGLSKPSWSIALGRLIAIRAGADSVARCGAA